MEFTRGCPWDCSFCSAWTFYGRSYRKASPEAAAAEVAAIAEPNVFLVNDVAFIRPEHGHAIAAELERRRVRKHYYLETRSDVLLRGQTNFVRMLWQFSRVYNETRQLADHERTVRYELPVPDHRPVGPQSRSELYIHPRRARRTPAP